MMKPSTIVVIIGAFAVIAITAGAGYSRYKQRGIRNNNPGNLVITSAAWKGKTPVAKNTDGHFEQFSSHLYGIRAMFRDIRGDIETDGLNTVTKLINTYAPPHENNTIAYITAVSGALKKSAHARIVPADYPALIAAIIKHENGVQPYPMSDIQRAIQIV